jgi:hypothetical protein
MKFAVRIKRRPTQVAQITIVNKNFQEEIPLKLKSLVVMTLLVLGCTAAFAQGSGTLGFTSAGGSFLYCNYEEFAYGGSNNYYFSGIDNLTTACFAPVDATILGVKTIISKLDNAPVQNGPAYAYADNIYDAFGEYFTGDQWFVVTQIKPSRLIHHYGWVGYVGFDGYEFLGNYGYLSASIPGAAGNKKPTQGTTSAASAKANKAQLTKTFNK